MKRLTVILIVLFSIVLLSGCVTVKKANELFDERLEALYPDINFEELNNNTIKLSEKQVEIESAVTAAKESLDSALEEGITKIETKASDTEQAITSVSEQAEKTIGDKTLQAEKSLQTITLGATEELNKTLKSVKLQLDTTVSGSVSTIEQKSG
ncbi:MAG: hypothetical protein EOM15_07120, partial [Spirochaetia bacterium]|nr:hypothetical protein [Spirochaetia bacterium]